MQNLEFSLKLIFILTIAFTQLARVFTSAGCSSYELEELGCRCSTQTEIKELEADCQNGLYELSCNLKDYLYVLDINYFDLVIESLEKIGKQTCWFDLRIKNVLSITKNSFKNVQFKSSMINNQRKEIHIEFLNVFEIEAFAFEFIRLKVNESLIITLDNFYDFNNEAASISKSLVLGHNCFSNIISLKLLEFKNFKSKLNLKASHFHNSRIQTISVDLSNFDGFTLDSDGRNLYISIKNLIINNCFVNEIESKTLGNFHSLESIRITHSAVSLITLKVFQSFKHLKVLDLSNNLIERLQEHSFNGLYKLRYLNLENNPIDIIYKNAFYPLRQDLVKLNLKSSYLSEFLFLDENSSNADFQMSSLKELILSDTSNLKASCLPHLFKFSPNLEYLSLESSNVLKSNSNLNTILDTIESIVDSESDKNLKFLDLTSRGVYLDDVLFRQVFNSYDTSWCLWNKVLKKTFIKIDPDHPLTCSLVYLYRNLENYHLPFTENHNDIDLAHSYIKREYFKVDLNDSRKLKNLFLILPKSYSKLLSKNFTFDLIRDLENACGFASQHDENINCSFVQTTAQNPTTITKFSTETTEHFLSSTFSAKKDELFIKKKIVSEYTLPIMFTSFSIAIVMICLLILKAKYDYGNKFLKIYKKTLIGSEQEPKEMDNIICISSNNYAINVPDTNSLISGL